MRPCKTDTKSIERISAESAAKSWLNLKVSKKPALFALQIQENFSISMEKDVEEVHPPRFWKKSRLTNTRSLVFWEPHQEVECKTCNFATVVKKGGRPSKPKRGRGKLSTAASQKWQTESKVVDFCKMVDSLVENLPSNRRILEKLSFVGEVPRDYFCPVSLDILDKPAETDCEHYFCSNCVKEVVITSGNLSCPMCKEDSLNSMRVLTCMVINFIKDLSVISKTCGQNTRYEDCADHVCININERARLDDQPRPIAGIVGA